MTPVHTLLMAQKYFPKSHMDYFICRHCPAYLFSTLTIRARLLSVSTAVHIVSVVHFFPKAMESVLFRQGIQEPVCGADEPVTQTHNEARQKESVSRST